MFNFEFDEKRFEIIKEQLLRALKNFKAEQPYQHAVYFLALLLTEHAWTKQELIDAVARRFQVDKMLKFQWNNSRLLTVITIERLQQYIKDFLSRMHVECFIHGNVNKQKVRTFRRTVRQQLTTFLLHYQGFRSGRFGGKEIGFNACQCAAAIVETVDA